MAPTRQMEEREYDNMVKLHTVAPGDQGIAKHMTRNYNRFGKTLSEQRPRKIIDYNEKAGGLLETSYYNPNSTGQDNNASIVKRPINYNTGRLPGLLYNQLESTLDYYDGKLKTEKFLAGYSGSRLDLGYGEQMRRYNNIIKNKRYEKIL